MFPGYDYLPLQCCVAGTSYSTLAFSGNYYYLVVPANALVEGSYGRDSGGSERPVSSSACKMQNLSPCN
ncbi:MAG: hypothetical protein A2Y62_01545 [Candidatus Fischerbacteria bacterium RBG_13_37_8]|uniref:Uncharacterized protein n=1 Tax=Candidatus Fischerbacteria bacterium RBG_13_37_8 TaxID=1817863 RepID=A0A1F5VU35_9BACT|nr:MAG: hypothetical protein A2Y62_01545 [Candidatus Fischerbacteria bacterium RBG_13_37_8]